MKQRITEYVFNPAGKQISFPNRFDLSLDGFLLITNLTSNVMIFNFATSTLNGSLAGNVLTLIYDTTLMSFGDELQIWYDAVAVIGGDPTIDLLQQIADTNEQIRNGQILLLNLADSGMDYSIDDLSGEQQQ